MYPSGSSGQWEEQFKRLSIDNYDMAPLTRRGAQEGRVNNADVHYQADTRRGRADHSYHVDFDGGEPMRRAISNQAQFIGHDIKLRVRDEGGEDVFVCTMTETVQLRISQVFDDRGKKRTLIECTCGHRTDECACRHVYGFQDQIMQSYLDQPDIPFQRERKLKFDQSGSRMWFDVKGLPKPLDVYTAIEFIGVESLESEISWRIRERDPAEWKGYYCEAIQARLAALDEFVLCGEDFGNDLEYTVQELRRLEENIFQDYDRFNHHHPDRIEDFSRRGFIPTLLKLLRGVISRYRREIRDVQSREMLPSGDLYGRLIRSFDPFANQPFALRTLRRIPPNSPLTGANIATRQQFEDLEEVYRLLQRVNGFRGVNPQDPAHEFEGRLGDLLRHWQNAL